MPRILPNGTIVSAPQIMLPPKTNGRRLSDWLAAFLEHTSELESPINYLRWTGLSTIGAAAQRKLFRDCQAYTLYPNMFIWLVGPPGTKKSTAIRAGKQLLKKIPTIALSSDAPSVVGLMKDFDDLKTSSPAHQSLNAFIMELSTLFENASETMTGFLTNIYDGDADYSKRTRIGAKEEIPFPWFNLIAGTTPRWIGDNLKTNAVEGGLVARTLFIYSAEQKFLEAEPEITPEFYKRQEVLVNDLAHISQLYGQFEWAGGRAGDAFQWYEKWYCNSDRMPRIPDSRTAGYYVRKPIHLLKVAMLLSLSKRDSLKFELPDLEIALAMLDKMEPGMKRAFSAVGSNPYATDLERIQDQIESAGAMSYAEILAANYHNIEPIKLEQTLMMLLNMGRVRKGIVALPDGRQTVMYQSATPHDV